MSRIRFRWVYCQLDTLRQCLPSTVRQTLEELPESLDETYERILKDIRKSNKPQAYRMLQCIVVAIRPLSVAELAELLAIEVDAAKGDKFPKLNTDWRWEDHEQALLSTCSSLITIVGSGASGVVQFSHFSVKEFLMSDRLATSPGDISCYRIVPEDAHAILARTCLGVLLRNNIDQHDPDTIHFAEYAARHWVTHARVKNVASHIRDGMEELFDPDQPYFSAWLQLYNADNRLWSPELESQLQPGAAPLYHAAFCGLHELVEYLAFEYPQYANAIGGLVGTALHSASDAGHVEAVLSLLKCGVDVDPQGLSDQSPLQLASFNGHLGVVKCLLDNGADVNYQDKNRYSPLSHAIWRSHVDIVRVLLEHDADANIQVKHSLTPMHISLLYGPPKGDHPEIFQLLLEHGAKPDTYDYRRRTPLFLTPSEWRLDSPTRLEVARILLAHGADVDAECERQTTPLESAVSHFQHEMAQLFSVYSSK
jgi:ankyrin repeat protein